MSFGYVYVASMSSEYYRAAIHSAVSLKDYYPEAKITLFTHPEFFKESDRKFFDQIHLDIPYNVRAKMHGMARTPYKKTLYVDADTEIRSEKIKDVFDILKDNDIMFTRIIPHVSNTQRIDDNNDLEYHGGIILYNSKQLTIDLLKEWYRLYQYQIDTPWANSKFKQYDKRMQPWDQFTIWYLLHNDKKYSKIKHDFFPNGGVEYNFISWLEITSMKQNVTYANIEQIIYHYTLSREKVNAGRIKNKP